MEKLRYKNVGLCLSVLFVLVGVSLWTILRRQVTQCKCRRRPEMCHLSLRKRRWNGRLKQRFEFRLRLKGLLFLGCWTTAQSMDAGQAAQMMNQTIQMTEATTSAAKASASVLEKMEKKKALDEPRKLSDFATPEVQELATRLYSILASYIKGPALQRWCAPSRKRRTGFLSGNNYGICTCPRLVHAPWQLGKQS